MCFKKQEQSVGDLLYCKAEWVIALRQRLVSPSLRTPQEHARFKDAQIGLKWISSPYLLLFSCWQWILHIPSLIFVLIPWDVSSQKTGFRIKTNMLVLWFLQPNKTGLSWLCTQPFLMSFNPALSGQWRSKFSIFFWGLLKKQGFFSLPKKKCAVHRHTPAFQQ